MRLDIEVRSSGTKRDDFVSPCFVDRDVPTSLVWQVVDAGTERLRALYPRDGVAVIIRRAE